jgi:hypothetical protein
MGESEGDIVYCLDRPCCLAEKKGHMILRLFNDDRDSPEMRMDDRASVHRVGTAGQTNWTALPYCGS